MPILVDVSKLQCDPATLKMDALAIWPFVGSVQDVVRFMPNPTLDRDPVFADIKRAVEAAFPERADDLMRSLELHWLPTVKVFPAPRFIADGEYLSTERMNEIISDIYRTITGVSLPAVAPNSRTDWPD